MLPSFAAAEILAMMNYESKTADSLKAMKLTGKTERQEGIAIMDVDPNSSEFGKTQSECLNICLLIKLKFLMKVRMNRLGDANYLRIISSGF